MRTACLASSLLVLAACAGGAPSPSPPTPAPSPGAAAPSPAAPAIAERERACEEYVLVLEAIGRCDGYPLRDGLPGMVDRLRRGWGELDPTSVALQELVRDECHLASLGWLDLVPSFGCALPPTPELSAWSARPRTPPLGSHEDECAGAAAVVDTYRACEGLPPWAVKAGASSAEVVAHVAHVAANAGGDPRAAGLHCRAHRDGLARIAAELGCAGVASR
jgi:hypothetical protein